MTSASTSSTSLPSNGPRDRVLVFGTFDMLHRGHEFVLHQAAARGQVFVVVARDSTVLKLKGRPPVHNEEDRLEAILAFLPHASALLGDDTGDFLAPVREVHPTLILLGYDQKLPPGVTEADLPCRVERLPAFEPDTYKSSLLRPEGLA